ncbi:hypothetical protein NX059_000385 [Plenodomus lindquistii]|nr:hypothetical protein NX059_000385 [Plenodomus lindquistii]
MARSILHKPVNPLTTQLHRTSTTTPTAPTTPSALPSGNQLLPKSEKSYKVASKRVPPGLIVAKSFSEDGHAEVEEVFDCRKKRSTDAKYAQVVKSKQEQAREEGVGTAISRGVRHAGSAIRSLFQGPEESHSQKSSASKDEVAG